MSRFLATLGCVLLTSVGWTASAQEPAAGARPTLTLDFEFFKSQVQPIFAEKRPGFARCVACHQDFPATGFRIEAPGPDGKWTDEQTRRNFASASGRVVPGQPMRSRLLRHPLRQDSGGDRFHSGGKHWETPNAPQWQKINQWVMGAKG